MTKFNCFNAGFLICGSLAFFFIPGAFALVHKPIPQSSLEDRCQTYRDKLTWKVSDFPLPPGGSAENEKEEKKENEKKPGHSSRGQGFDGGPRKLSGLKKGLPNLNFPITTKNPEAQKFFTQGIAQLHAYQFLEAERSFRHVLELDPQTPMAYIGMALAAQQISLYPDKRSRALIETALKMKAPTEREGDWVKAMGGLLNSNYLAEMQKLADKYPKDTEVQAFNAHALLLSLNGIDEKEEGKRVKETEAALKRVFELDPKHPAHHYWIHLWDGKDLGKAAQSAIEVGPSMPGIGHMWHMPTHHYSRLNKDREVTWHQEAALRSDNSYMKDSDVMPNEIHNYTHNVSLLIDNLWEQGRAQEAIALSDSFLKTPADPNFPKDFGTSIQETIQKNLLSGLETAGMWQEILDRRNSPLFDMTTPPQEIRLVLLLARAAAQTKNKLLFAEQKKSLLCLIQLAEEHKDIGKEEAKWAKLELPLLEALLTGDDQAFKTAYENQKKDPKFTPWVEDATRAGDHARLKEIYKKMKEGSPLAFTTLLLEAELALVEGKKEEAKKTVEKLIERFGKPTPKEREFGYQKKLAALMERLEMNPPEVPLWKDDKHPGLSTFGSLHYEAPTAPDFPAKKPTVILFNLGSGCAHCNQQLKEMIKQGEDLKKQGLEVVVVTNEIPEQLKRSLEGFKKMGMEIPFPVMGDESLAHFKKFGAYDEFDKAPLHGLFLIDKEGKMRWRDIGAEPYMALAGFKNEAGRLLRTKSNLSR